MASINYQRKGVRISIAVFGSGDAGAAPALDLIRRLCDPPPEMMSIKEDDGEVVSFFAPIDPKKADGIEFMARFFSATDSKGDLRIWSSLLKQADGVIFVTGPADSAADPNSKARILLDGFFPLKIADTPVVFLCTGECSGDPDTMDKRLQTAGKPVFIANPRTGAAIEAAGAAFKGAINRFQRQFELMGGQGRVVERIRLGTAAVRAASGDPALAGTEEAGPAVEQVAEAKPDDVVASRSVPGNESTVNEPAGPVVINAEPPKEDPGGGGAGMAQNIISDEDVTGLTESLRSASAVVSKVPALCEAVAHVAVAVRMITTRVEGLEKAADEMPRADFGLDAAERIGSLLSEAGHSLAALAGEKERLISLLGESDEAREAERRKHEEAATGAKVERDKLEAEIAALNGEIQRLNQALSESAGGHEDLSARLQEEKAAREAEARQHESSLAAAGEERAMLAEKAEKSEKIAAEAHKEVEVLKVAVESVEQQLAAAKSESATVKSQAERHAGEARDMSVRLAEIEREIKDGVSQVEKTRAEAAELRSALDAAQNMVNSFREQVMAEQARAAAAREAEQKAHSELKTIRSETAAVMGERDAALSAAEDAKRGADEARAQLKAVEAETRSIRQDAAKKDAHIRALTEEIGKKEADVASLKGSIGEMAAKFQEAASLATLQGVHVRQSSPPTPYPPASAPRRGPVLPPNVPLPPKRVTQKFGSNHPEAQKQAPGGHSEESKNDEDKKS
jgi:predicted  nucleic acid-binding Zn-ribbon protein